MAQFKDIGNGLHLGSQPTEQDLQEAKKAASRPLLTSGYLWKQPFPTKNWWQSPACTT